MLLYSPTLQLLVGLCSQQMLLYSPTLQLLVGLCSQQMLLYSPTLQRLTLQAILYSLQQCCLVPPERLSSTLPQSTMPKPQPKYYSLAWWRLGSRAQLHPSLARMQ
jgi:hypothetical protein